jgi:photosystem II stability/assembly factor-like uncharacterized protein
MKYRVRSFLSAGATLGVLLSISGCGAGRDRMHAAVDPGGARMAVPALLDVTRASGGVVAVGEHGRIALAKTGSGPWQVVQAPTSELLTAVDFAADGRNGWAVGHGPVILRTINGGQSWSVQHAGGDTHDSLLDVLAIDANHAVAVGAYGLMRRTQNGGHSWQVPEVSEAKAATAPDLVSSVAVASSSATRPDAISARMESGQQIDNPIWYAVTCLPRRHCRSLFAVGEDGMVVRSDDLGASWRQLAVPVTSTLFGIIADDSNRLLAFGLLGHAVASEDGGASWHAVETGTTKSLFAGTWRADGSAVVVGANGTVRLYQPGDPGAMSTLPSSGRQALAGIQALTGILPETSGTYLLIGMMGVARLSLPAAENKAGNKN